MKGTTTGCDADEIVGGVSHQTSRITPHRVPTARRRDSYADVQASFQELRSLPEGSDEYVRLRAQIIERCLSLADHIARRYDRRGESHDDLVQVARVGLMNAVNRFDPESGDFVAFAVPTIMGEVKRHFRDCSWSVKVPRRLKDLYPQIAPAVSELSQRLGRGPTPSEIATELGVDRQDVVEGMTAGAGFRAWSIEASLGHDDEGPTIADRLGEADPGIRFIEDREALRVQLAALPERQRQIVLMRFFESLSQSQIAERVGISQMHVSRLLAQALRALRDGMSEPVPERSARAS
jgi:RNA polymerase sigma-B factor